MSCFIFPIPQDWKRKLIFEHFIGDVIISNIALFLSSMHTKKINNLIPGEFYQNDSGGNNENNNDNNDNDTTTANSVIIDYYNNQW